MNGLENLLYEVSKFFLMPVLIVLSIMFAFALISFGGLLAELVQRLSGRKHRRPLERWLSRNSGANIAALELELLRRLESLRIVSRVAPMLGLVATMIPMGPALVSVSSGDTQGMAENLVVAFAAVVIALLAAALTYVVLLVRRRWLLAELNSIALVLEAG